MSDGVPLVPDPDEARRWVEQELSDPAYARAQPTPLDRAARAVVDAIAQLFQGDGGQAWGPVLAVVAVLVLVAVVVVALIVWGRPRRLARSAQQPAGLFGDARELTAEQLREESERAASAGEWDVAIAARLRALARALDERGLVETAPGATVHAFARNAAGVFPAYADRLDAAAAAFDDVRYLRRPGTAAAFRDLRELDATLARSAAVAEAR
ncbi:DUF4129 domain-containing protein [Microbacterium sp. SORGH_AS_0888]|uniref:DUF4129 domain-containing protein n=1 Tax=Microbacterium sp. SORGH_AS_0888 TaxID=3041791 RepID=UPI00277D5820|nr:DUF4129 domain-containing protein [Microbacterium sp. SORGH_AS_0888]MDQ1127918.1 Sec-independent protein translocase protein TatA [Microbacterium sp. SORGH_AS_0888]